MCLVSYEFQPSSTGAAHHVRTALHISSLIQGPQRLPVTALKTSRVWLGMEDPPCPWPVLLEQGAVSNLGLKLERMQPQTAEFLIQRSYSWLPIT